MFPKCFDLEALSLRSPALGMQLGLLCVLCMSDTRGEEVDPRPSGCKTSCSPRSLAYTGRVSLAESLGTRFCIWGFWKICMYMVGWHGDGGPSFTMKFTAVSGSFCVLINLKVMSCGIFSAPAF